jgi:hypothetical protein
MRHNLRVHAEQIGARSLPGDPRKYLDLNYLNEALAELGKRQRSD